MTTEKITFLFNWRATPYHAPVFLAQHKGFFAEQGIQVAILNPNDPSDVTELVGTGRADIAAKAMIHTIAAKARGFPVKSIGTMMDEPFTGLVYLKSSGFSKFEDIKGKRIGYVGEFGKVQLDELTAHFGLKPDDYTAVRCGMNISRAIQTGEIHAGIGLENVQCVELEEWKKTRGEDPEDVQLLRRKFDELAELGCCCFCSILYIANEPFLEAHPDKAKKFMAAVKKGSDYLLANPSKAWGELKDRVPEFNSPLQDRIFERSFAYMSVDNHNVERDWTKVTTYSKRLGIVDENFVGNYTNEYLSWKPEEETETPDEKQKTIAAYQKDVAAGKKSCLVAATA